MGEKKYKKSRFNAMSHTDSGELILFNSYTGAIATFSKEEEGTVVAALKGETISDQELTKNLHEMGFLVSEQVDEMLRAEFLHQTQHRTDALHLSILPTEECNFRCIYCYENFPRGKMTDQARKGLQRFVQEKSTVLKNLSVSWYGGEPLLALDVIGELSESFIASSKENDVDYSAEIATNGYYLSVEVFQQLLDWQITRFMVTLDGPEDVHNSRRVHREGGKSFQNIFDNLLEIAKLPGDFEMHLRVNFDNSNLGSMDSLIDLLSEHFAGDPRFQMYFRPVGRWGGKNDEHMPVCDSHTADTKVFELSESALQKGLNMSSYVENLLTPAGAVCYCAKPTALVVSADGSLHKCTLALDEEINQIGQINEDGSLDLDYDRLAFWVTSGEEKDEVCQSCFFRPACQGNNCPFYRKATGQQPCSFEKKQIKKVLNLIWQKNILLQKG